MERECNWMLDRTLLSSVNWRGTVTVEWTLSVTSVNCGAWRGVSMDAYCRGLSEESEIIEAM